MTKTEEVRLHNLFVKFKNENKTLDEISGLLKLDYELLERWNVAFEVTRGEIEIRKMSGVEVDIIGVNSDGKYRLNHVGNGPRNELEKVKYLLRLLALQSRDEKKAATAGYFLPILNYFTLFSTNFDDDEQTFVFNFSLNTKDKKIIKKAKEAIKFYTEIQSDLTNLEVSLHLMKISRDIYLSANKILPYALKTLRVKNFDGILETGFEKIPIDTNWMFFIGENGYGKTTLLRSIAIGFVGTNDGEVELFSPYSDNGIGIEYYFQSRSIINNVGLKLKPFNNLACYGSSRLQIQTDQTQNDVAKKSSTTYSLFNSDGILLNIEYELLIWYLEKSPKFEVVKNTLLKLIPYLADIQIDQPNRKVLYFEKEPDDSETTYNPVNFNQLASGFKSIIAMVGDMMIRLFKSQPTVTEPSELAGVVIIDELDLHLHPKMQREVPRLLSSIFPKVQFIASTHSLVPLLGAPKNSVLLKVNRTHETGITVEKLDVDFQALSTDTMLRDIFDLENYMSDLKKTAWERYTQLKGLIHFENDETKKNKYINERSELGDKYNFGV